MNWIIVPTLILAITLSWAGKILWRKRKPGIPSVALLLCAAVFAVPGALMVLYYFHLFDNAVWFYRFRALPLTELSAAGAGVLAGILAAAIKARRIVSESFILCMLFISIAIPHLKPVLVPVPDKLFQDRWTNGVCLQSTPSSCGPASAATLLRMSGIFVSEEEIARRCFSYGGGTENWYLGRFLTQHGLRVEFITDMPESEPVPVPSIAGVKIGRVGHFIPIMSLTEDTYVTGDPLVGREEWDSTSLRRHFKFTGFFMKIETNNAWSSSTIF